MMLSSVGTSVAAPTWNTPEPVPTAMRAFLAPDGTGLVVGKGGSSVEFATRAKGGTTGAFTALPYFSSSVFDADGKVRVVFDGASNALIGNVNGSAIAYRPAGAASAIGATTSMGANNKLGSMSMISSGDAFIAMGGSPGTIKVGFRPAGAASIVDSTNAQDFGKGNVIGTVLDPDGSGIVVFTDAAGALFQAVRPAGSAVFTSPTEISAPGLHPSEYQVVMSSDPSGNAVLTWSGSSSLTTAKNDRAVASFRGPGQAFPVPSIVGASAPGMYGGVQTVIGATNAQGDAMVAWTQGTSTDICASHQGNVADYGAYASTYHAGTWSPAVALGPAAFPEVSAIREVRGAGSHFVAVIDRDHQGADRCEAAGVIDDQSDVLVRAAVSTASGVAFTEDHLLATTYTNAEGRYTHPSFLDLALNASGGVLAVYRDMNGTFVASVDGGESLPPTTGKPQIKPINPARLIKPRAINISKPSMAIACPRAVDDECAFKVRVYHVFKAKPKKRGSQARKLVTKRVLLGSFNAKLKPGKKRVVKFKMTKAGKAAIKANKTRKVQLVMTTKANGNTVTRKANVKLKAKPKPKKHKPKPKPSKK
ncbi:MAG: hypothetical protein ABI200_05325 [Gaiellales bacterium]